MATVIRLSNGNYVFRNRQYSYRRVQLAAYHAGFRFLEIVDQSGGHVDTLDLT